MAIIWKLLFLLILDEKEKYDPTSFRDQIVAGLNEANEDLEQVCIKCWNVK